MKLHNIQNKKTIFILMALAVVVINIIVVCSIDGFTDSNSSSGNEPLASNSSPVPDYSYIPSESDTASAADVPKDETQAPLETLKLVQSVNCPLPGSEFVLQQYDDYPIRGTIASTTPIESVSIVIDGLEDSSDADAREYKVDFSADLGILMFDLSSAQLIESGRSLDELVNLSSLKKGEYRFLVSAKNATEEKELYNGAFTVAWSRHKPLYASNFRDNYSIALSFFKGDTERFMFKYVLDDTSRRISIEKEWREKYLTLTEINEKKCYVHIDALPCLENALSYTESTYIRVHGNGKDSGVIKLSSLIESFDGAFVSRLVRNDDYVSHHSFGTAFDFNASRNPNTLSIGNRQTITDEVGQRLTYIGLAAENGITYYDFEYTGTYDVYFENVPYTVINYLLYELAFYRAGFGWGYYFSHTCDAMHFSLTELDITVHSAEGTGLKKVFEYADAQ